MLMTIFFFLTSLGTSLHLPLSLQCCAQKRTRFLPFCLKFIVWPGVEGRRSLVLLISLGSSSTFLPPLLQA